MNQPGFHKKEIHKEKVYQRIKSTYIIVFFCGMIGLGAFLLGYSVGEEKSVLKTGTIRQSDTNIFPGNQYVFRKDLSSKEKQVYYFIEKDTLYNDSRFKEKQVLHRKRP